MRKMNNLENLMYIQMQIDQKKKYSQLDHEDRWNTYAKPHFGPEETDESLRNMILKKKQDQDRVR